MRFAHGVSDGFMIDYARRMADMDSVVYAYVLDCEVRAVAELRKLADDWGEEAEAAFSVETSFQDRGLGSQLMGKIIQAARNRGVRRLHISCLADNQKMQAIARKHEATLKLEAGQVVGDIVPSSPDDLTIRAEHADDRIGIMLAAIDLGRRVFRAA